MKGLYCDCCKIFVKGSASVIIQHRKSQKHKMNKNQQDFEARLKNQSLRANGNSKRDDIQELYDMIQQQTQKLDKIRQEQIAQKTGLMNKQNLQMYKPYDLDNIWLNVVDFDKDEVYYYNQMTGEKKETLPFGVDINKIKIVPKYKLPAVIQNQWEEVQKHQSEFDDNQIFIEENDLQKQNQLDVQEPLVKRNKTQIQAVNYKPLQYNKKKTESPVTKKIFISNPVEGNVQHLVRKTVQNVEDQEDDLFKNLEKLIQQKTQITVTKIEDEQKVVKPCSITSLLRKKKIRKNN